MKPTFRKDTKYFTIADSEELRTAMMPTQKLALDGTKIAHPAHAERIRAWLTGERVAPITIDMALTQKCQINCVFCYANLQQNPSEPVPWQCYSDFLDDCVTIGHKRGEGVKAISLVSDGESTLNKDFYRFISKARANGLDMACGTNGIALRKDKMVLLVEALTYLRINLNAATAEANARIMGAPESAFYTVIDNITDLVRIKTLMDSPITIGLQMVLMPEYANEVVHLAKFGRGLGVDYLVIKHCTDDESGRLGVNYDWYKSQEAEDILREAEAQSGNGYSVQVKWSKIRTGRARTYSRCYGTPLHLQMSGTGIVAPCGSFFHARYARYHIGDIKQTRFRDIWASEAYWEVMQHLRSDQFDARKDCATLCVQDRTNLALSNLVEHGTALPTVPLDIPHVNFI